MITSRVAAVINILQSFLGSDIDGISPPPLPDKVLTNPYVTVQEVNEYTIQDLDGPSGLEDSIIQVNAFHPDSSRSSDIRTRSQRYLNTFYGPALDLTIQGAAHRNSTELYDGTRQIWQHIARMNMWFGSPEIYRKNLFTDSFQRPDSVNLGGNWVETEVIEPRLMQLIGGILHVGGIGPPVTQRMGFARFNTPISNNQFSELIMKNTIGLEHAGPSFGPMCRLSYDGTRLTAYELAIQSFGLHGAREVIISLYRVDSTGGGANDLWDYPTPVLVNDGDSFRLEAVGQTLTVKHNGTILNSLVDSFFPSGSVGMGDISIFSDWELQFTGWNGGEL